MTAWWLRRPVHTSWRVAVMSFMFVAGVFSALYASAPLWLAVCGAILVASALRFSAFALLVLGSLGSLAIGVAYGGFHLGERSAYDLLIGQEVTLAGSLREDPSVTASGSLSLQLNNVVVDEYSLPGAILATVPASTPAKRGDTITIFGRLDEGIGSYGATMSRARVKGLIRPVPGDVGRRVRDWFADAVRVHIDDPQASLGIGFLTGQKNALPGDLSEALKVVGLTHIVVASGYNLTILVRLSRKLFLRVSKYVSALASMLMIVIFVAVTGISPSMMRAGLVSSMSLLAWYYGRAFHPFVLLPFSAMITVALQPSYVWGDLGWQLSFAAFAGVMIVAPLLQHYFFGDKEPGVLRGIFGETLAAHIVTVPVIALSFGVTSNVAIIANILVVPLVPLAMLLTFIVGVLSLVGLPFIWLVATPTEWLLGYMVKVASSLSELSWAQEELIMPGWAWGCYVVVLTLACFWMWRVTKHDFRGSKQIY